MYEFENVYYEYHKRLYLFLLQLCGNTHLAEELTQETFYQMFLHINQFKGNCSIFTWLCQIGKNAWFKECKRSKRYADTLDKIFEPSHSYSLPEEKILKNEQLKELRKAILQLEEPYQNVFIMHVFGEIPLKEIAKEHQKSDSWARMTYLRAKEKIKRSIDYEK